MKPLRMVLICLAFACSPVAHEDDHDDPHDDPHDHDEEGGDDPSRLRIDADLLRDLRTTTAPARTVASDERAVVLGELDVDEGRYAAVGVPIAARVRRVVAVPGDVVTAGAVLAELESVEVGRARADLVGARARASLARTSLERRRTLGSDLVSARDLEHAQAEAAVADADEQAAEATLVGLGVGTSAEGGAVFSVRSPIGGRVLDRDLRRGELVDPHRTLFEVADTTVLWLVAHASERDALRVRVGDEVEVLFAALPNEPSTAVVARVGESVDPVSRTIPLRIDVPNPDGRLRRGMSATAQVPLGGSGGAVVAVPGEALQRLGDAWVVFVPAAEGSFGIRPVGRGRDLGSDVEILSGLADGEVVVVDGAFLLKAQAEKQAGGGDAHHH